MRFFGPRRCKNDKCKRILSDRGRPNKSGFCSNCLRQDPKNRKKWLNQQKKWRENKKILEKSNIKNKNKKKQEISSIV